jgi:molybdopterin/thiamine biosynthesis adenylyltransferase/proteasome lid subunit RPN8/RPN11
VRRAVGNMTVTLVLPVGIAAELDEAARNPLETAGVLLATIIETPRGDLRILGREIRWVVESAYGRREAMGLSIASHGYVHALGRAEELGASAIWFHTHPGIDGVPTPSLHDRQVDRDIADLFRLRSGSTYYGALVASPRPGGIAFTGHLLPDDEHEEMRIERLWVVGDRCRLVRAFDSDAPELPGLFDRNVRAFGTGVQGALNELHAAVVGCGGTGSVVAEQLVRLGVRQFTLIDPDRLSETNLTRVYGSTPPDVGRAKVEVVGEHLARIAPSARVGRLQGSVALEVVARALSECDVVFGCTDDNAGRLVLSRIATYLLTPVIDCGVLLSANSEGQLTGIDGRVTVLGPGAACLVCRDRIDLPRAAAELLTPQERRRREDEGYAPALGNTEPAVVSFTTAVGAAAVGELLERLVGYGPEPRPTEILLRWHDREVSTNIVSPRERHYCHPAAGKFGLGDAVPFLEQTWPA